MGSLSALLSRFELGDPITQHNLDMFPLIDREPQPPFYLLLEEAVTTKKFRITELSESGSVPNLLVINELDQAVLIVDGEQMVGAKQNRIANLTILVPARTTLKIPVSCVEQGRWSFSRPDFLPSPDLMFGKSRSHKAARVSYSLCQAAVPDADQQAVWSEVHDKLSGLHADSPTGAMGAAFESQRGRLEDYVQGLKSEVGQAGALFAVNGRLTALDLFDSPATLGKTLGKLVRSQAIDAIEQWDPHPPRVAPTAAPAFLQDLGEAGNKSYPGIGLGTMLRLEGPNLAGGALVCEEHLVHLCAFRLSGNGSRPRRGGMFVD